jgi:hypothetical protein
MIDRQPNTLIIFSTFALLKIRSLISDSQKLLKNAHFGPTPPRFAAEVQGIKKAGRKTRFFNQFKLICSLSRWD